MPKAPPLYDWPYYKHCYVSDPTVTLAELSKRPQGPSIEAIKKRALREAWTASRAEYQLALGERTRTAALTTEAEVNARHAKQARSLVAKGLAALEKVDPDRIGPREVVNYIKVGIELERKALGLDVQRVEVEHKDANPDEASIDPHRRAKAIAALLSTLADEA